ncbi:hypothetical protein [Catellatospora sichuanensis]|uniref:hypothetical protein n=1 Tax=Catellatospora sichuanensis TaxID=1969805 RepID=UPI001183C61F|nr:hypothetical protein [Catellatospora sichuanensis]
MPPYGSDLQAWSRAVSALLGRPAKVTAVLAQPGDGKAHGMTHSVELQVECDGQVRTAFLKTPREDLYAEGLDADAIREVAWRLEGYPWFSGHVRCAGAGRFTADGMQPLTADDGPPWVLEWAQPGIRYADRLAVLDTLGAGQAAADGRTLALAMIALHRPVPDGGPALHRRAIRDALIVPVHRLIDTADALWAAEPGLRAEVEHACARWRLLLAGRHDRLRYVHHDFHPWNVFLAPSGQVHLIGARLPGVGDPYDDLAAFAVNYLWFGHARHGRFDGAYRAGFEAMRETFATQGLVEPEPALMSPFLAKRLLVLLNPTYYPDLPAATAAWLRELLRRCLTDDIDLLHGDIGTGLPARIGTRP